MRLKEKQILVKKLKNGQISVFTIKNGNVFDSRGHNPVYCSCTGNTPATATPMKYNSNKRQVYCPNCSEKKVEVLQTYEEWKKERNELKKQLNEEKLKNLHLVVAGSDWECGLQYYGLSAQIDADEWKKIKKYFNYYRNGWSGNMEMEWETDEPNGWLTQNPEEVEKILLDAGLMKKENTIKAIAEKKAIAREKRAKEIKEKSEKRKEIKNRIEKIKGEINIAFDNAKQLSEAEAREEYFNPTYRLNNVVTYTIKNDAVVQCNHMGDFVYGVSIPYSKNVEKLIKDLHDLDLKIGGF